MREIKFRGKTKDNGEWVYGSLLISEPQEKILEPLHYFVCPLDDVDVSRYFEVIGNIHDNPEFLAVMKNA